MVVFNHGKSLGEHDAVAQACVLVVVNKIVMNHVINPTGKADRRMAKSGKVTVINPQGIVGGLDAALRRKLIVVGVASARILPAVIAVAFPGIIPREGTIVVVQVTLCIGSSNT